MNADEPMRLNHYIAACGHCSRRDADALISAGRVRVDGREAVLGQKVNPGEVVTVDSQALQLQQHQSYLYYKPQGIVCTSRDPHARQTLTEELHRMGLPHGLTYAGRLDKDSEGALLLTNDGALIERVAHGAHGHEKEYLVELDRPLTEEALRRIRGGVYLPELARRTLPCQAACPMPADVPALSVIEPEEVRGELCRAAEDGRLLQIVLTQGLNRQIRRTCRAIGYTNIVRLIRIRIEHLLLGDLLPGTARPLTQEELSALHSLG